MKPNSERPAGTGDDERFEADSFSVSQHSRKPPVVCRVLCFFGRHYWSGDDGNVCKCCGKVAIGLPRFVNAPPPPPLKPISSPSAAEEVEDFERSEDCSPS